ncbi:MULTISPECIES: Panacea domain-containing protein [unclassified Bradyrhizobium]|uniref:Panacea domain-containing protein n=1 Tax=unclassified Bradyrhizobium TaxID=2631580 RepID=UPI0028E3E9E0|nr:MULTISPECIES: Panacea domain-containing protein [unclassified Bradyrhizobium]
MSSIPETRAKLTWEVDLPGGQRRLREAVLYVSKACERTPFFGLVKLNKIIWHADFESFTQRGQPVTGRMYQKLRQGPAPVEMLPVLNDLQAEGHLKISRILKGHHYEQRPVALSDPFLTIFSRQDLDYLDRAVAAYWDLTAKEVSEKSHGVAWRTRENGEPMPYQSAYLSDEPIGAGQRGRLLKLGAEHGWRSK